MILRPTANDAEAAVVPRREALRVAQRDTEVRLPVVRRLAMGDAIILVENDLAMTARLLYKALQSCKG